MKLSVRAPLYCVTVVVVATLMGKIAVLAQDWRTVDDFALTGGNAEAHGVAVDAAGRIYVVGSANGHGIVRYSADGGTNWSTRDDFLYPSETENVFNAVTVDSQGTVFVGGGGGGHWIVRCSTNQGVSWETVDDYYRPMNGPEDPGTNGLVYSLSNDGQGRVYGAGLMHPTGPSYSYWLVRRSDIGGTNWDTKLIIFSILGDVSQITSPGEDVYVTGSAAGQAESTGLILKSSDSGATWTTNFNAIEDIHVAITHDSAANLYSAGYRQNSNSVDWLVRKAAPGGANWTILDTSTYERSSPYGISHPVPSSIAIDAGGNICVAGAFLDYSFHGNTWFTRQYSAASGDWSTTDLFSYTTNNYRTNMYGAGTGTAIAPDGSTFVVGYSKTDLGQIRWVVRKQSAFTPPPRLQIALGQGSVEVSWPGAYTNSLLERTDSPGSNQLWQGCTETVRKVDGRNNATVELTPGARFFRLRSAGGQ